MAERSNIKLKSNVMTADRATGANLNSFIPLEVLQNKISVVNFYDVRMRDFLPKQQLEAARKLTFLAKQIIDVEVESDDRKCDISSSKAEELQSYLEVNEKIDTNDSLTTRQRTKIEIYDRLTVTDGCTEEEKDKLIRKKQESKFVVPLPVPDDRKAENEGDSGTGEVSPPDRPPGTTLEKGQPAKTSSEPGKKTTKVFEDDKGDFGKKLERKKLQSERETEKIADIESCIRRAENAGIYTYGWFKALLEAETLISGENNANSRKISISFSKVEREAETERILVLKHPTRSIPQSMEDLADIPIELYFVDQTKIKVIAEGFSVKSYTLKAKLRTNVPIDGKDLSHITEARIVAKDTVFLMEELRKAFGKLNHEDDYDMQSNLCKNIEFVFGPPGTGKTTHLAENVILPIMNENVKLHAKRKILVLTPTNKAADVLVRRIMNNRENDLSYKDWLVRFGATGDSIIEESGVLRDRDFDIQNHPRNVTITTIARFPYDYFQSGGKRHHLSELDWDYIIIDEASMIPLVNIVYPLYKKAPKKFIIAGDPFQIEPITSRDLPWKYQNIYTLVGLDSLDSFQEHAKTKPHEYPVVRLTTQYRSIPAIGEVFSRFAYGGRLKHHRSSGVQQTLQIGELEIKPLNIIKFPVHKYESIYCPKKLQNSNYQIYSALFAFEFARYLAERLANSKEPFRIGLIAPYKAQAGLIERLTASVDFPREIDVQVGTIHGFQGDECDMIIALFNPPLSISGSKDMFLNKLNIINVSISRAKDYLFIMMPDNSTDNVDNLTLIKKVESLCKKQQSWIEHQSHVVEELIWGNKTYLEDNVFSTSHHSVNVYRKPEKRYEVRSEDNAVDVQIHEEN